MSREISNILEKPQKPILIVEISTSLEGGKIIQELIKYDDFENLKYPLLEIERFLEIALDNFRTSGNSIYNLLVYQS